MGTVEFPVWLAIVGALLALWALADHFLLPGARWVLRRRINRVLEELIRQRPEQYLWGYNRYKTPAGAKPKPA